VPGDGFGGDFVEGRNFTDIKAMNNAGGDGTCDLDSILCGQWVQTSVSRYSARQGEVRFFFSSWAIISNILSILTDLIETKITPLRQLTISSFSGSLS
jgi:hypothetical protein